MLCNATHHLGDGKRVILCQRVRGSVRAVRGVRNTQVFLTQTRVVADEETEVFLFMTMYMNNIMIIYTLSVAVA